MSNIIGLGTASIGRPLYINIGRKSSHGNFDLDEFIQQGKQLLSLAYKNGIRHFDTSPGYGVAEKIIIEWLLETNYKDVTISTKWGYTYVANFDPKAKIHEVKEHSINKLEEQWKYSSKLLPHLKIYQIHSATIESGVLENKEVLNKLFELKQNKKIAIGLSTSGDNQNEVIKKALDIKINGVELFDSFQVTFNVFDQNLLKINEELTSKNKKIIIKEALANGRVFNNLKFPKYKPHYIFLDKLAKKYQVGVDAIALRFCIDAINPFLVLSGAISNKHLKDNLKALSIQLTTTEINNLKLMAIKPKNYWEERKTLKWN